MFLFVQNLWELPYFRTLSPSMKYVFVGTYLEFSVNTYVITNNDEIIITANIPIVTKRQINGLFICKVLPSYYVRSQQVFQFSIFCIVSI